MSPPQVMKALVTGGPPEPWPVQVLSIPTPIPQKGEILVKVSCVCLNPSDWRGSLRHPPGVICGQDFCGTVVAIADGTGGDTNLKIGDRVAGVIPGCKERTAGYAEYLATGADVVWKVPPGCEDAEAAAMGGVGTWTAFQGVCLRCELGLPKLGVQAPVETGQTMLVWSGATSVGWYAIQIAKLLGLRVLATASKKNWAVLKDLGVEKCFDYKDEDVVEQIKAYAKDSIAFGVDNICLNESTQKSIECFGTKGGILVPLMELDRVEYTVGSVRVRRSLAFTLFGTATTYVGRSFSAAPEERVHLRQWLKLMPDLVKTGAIKSNPIRKCPGGLESIHEGFIYQKAGKVSGEKLTYSIENSFDPMPPALTL